MNHHDHSRDRRRAAGRRRSERRAAARPRPTSPRPPDPAFVRQGVRHQPRDATCPGSCRTRAGRGRGPAAAGCRRRLPGLGHGGRGGGRLAVLPASPRRGSRRPGAGLLRAASAESAMIAAGEAGPALTPRPRPAAAGPAPALAGRRRTVGTKAGERRRVALPDGSVLYVNQNTTVKLDAGAGWSSAAGEVFVEVAPRTRSRTAASSSRRPAARCRPGDQVRASRPTRPGPASSSRRARSRSAACTTTKAASRRAAAGRPGQPGTTGRRRARGPRTSSTGRAT